MFILYFCIWNPAYTPLYKLLSCICQVCICQCWDICSNVVDTDNKQQARVIIFVIRNIVAGSTWQCLVMTHTEPGAARQSSGDLQILPRTCINMLVTTDYYCQAQLQLQLELCHYDSIYNLRLAQLSPAPAMYCLSTFLIVTASGLGVVWIFFCSGGVSIFLEYCG